MPNKALEAPKKFRGPQKMKTLFFSKTAQVIFFQQTNLTSVNLMGTYCTGICLDKTSWAFTFNISVYKEGSAYSMVNHCAICQHWSIISWYAIFFKLWSQVSSSSCHELHLISCLKLRLQVVPKRNWNLLLLQGVPKKVLFRNKQNLWSNGHSEVCKGINGGPNRCRHIEDMW